MQTDKDLEAVFNQLSASIEKESAEMKRRIAISESNQQMYRLCSPVMLRAAALVEQTAEALRRGAAWMDTEEVRLNRESEK